MQVTNFCACYTYSGQSILTNLLCARKAPHLLISIISQTFHFKVIFHHSFVQEPNCLGPARSPSITGRNIRYIDIVQLMSCYVIYMTPISIIQQNAATSIVLVASQELQEEQKWQCHRAVLQHSLHQTSSVNW